jgi:acyl-homoserine lactone synthase
MIHLITAANRHLYQDALRKMYEARARYFVGQLNWGNLTVKDGMELDSYDNDDALYLVGFDDEGGIAVSARLIPADNGCILSEHFSYLVAEGEGPIAGPGIYELSRYFTAPNLRGRESFPPKAALNIAIVEAMVDRGARRLIGFTDLHVLGAMRYSGWRVRPLGLPAPYDEGTGAAFEIACQPADLTEIRTAIEFPGRRLFVAPSWLPAGTDLRSLADATELVVNLPNEMRQPAVATISSTVRGWRPQGDLEPMFARLGEREMARA